MDSVRSLAEGKDIYLAVTYNDLKEGSPMLDSLGYKPAMYSSKLLWNINEFLASKKINTQKSLSIQPGNTLYLVKPNRNIMPMVACC